MNSRIGVEKERVMGEVQDILSIEYLTESDLPCFPLKALKVLG